MTTEESNTLEAIRIWGGNFMKHLRLAYIAADDDNRRKIRETWALDWVRYEERGRMLQAQQEEETRS